MTSCAVLFLLNLMSGKYILRIADEGYLVQKNISLAFLKCIGVKVELCMSEMEYPAMNKNTNFSCGFILYACAVLHYYAMNTCVFVRCPELRKGLNVFWTLTPSFFTIFKCIVLTSHPKRTIGQNTSNGFLKSYLSYILTEN